MMLAYVDFADPGGIITSKRLLTPRAIFSNSSINNK